MRRTIQMALFLLVLPVFFFALGSKGEAKEMEVDVDDLLKGIDVDVDVSIPDQDSVLWLSKSNKYDFEITKLRPEPNAPKQPFYRTAFISSSKRRRVSSGPPNSDQPWGNVPTSGYWTYKSTIDVWENGKFVKTIDPHIRVHP